MTPAEQGRVLRIIGWAMLAPVLAGLLGLGGFAVYAAVVDMYRDGTLLPAAIVCGTIAWACVACLLLSAGSEE